MHIHPGYREKSPNLEGKLKLLLRFYNRMSRSSVSPSFLICADFNIHVDTSSNYSIKFQNCLESCNITQNVQVATHLYGHILDLVLTPTDASGISNVQVAEFISDHALVLAQLDSVNPPSHKTNVTFRRYHKIDLDSLRKDLEIAHL